MINQEIRELRLKMELSQEDFAHLVGVKLQSVSRWELGKGNPSFEAKRKIRELILKSEGKE